MHVSLSDFQIEICGLCNQESGQYVGNNLPQPRRSAHSEYFCQKYITVQNKQSHTHLLCLSCESPQQFVCVQSQTGHALAQVWFGLCCLMTPGLSRVRTFGVMYDHNFSKPANHPTRLQPTHKVGCRPGDCIWPFQSSSGVCVAMYELT